MIIGDKMIITLVIGKLLDVGCSLSWTSAVHSNRPAHWPANQSARLLVPEKLRGIKEALKADFSSPGNPDERLRDLRLARICENHRRTGAEASLNPLFSLKDLPYPPSSSSCGGHLPTPKATGANSDCDWTLDCDWTPAAPVPLDGRNCIETDKKLHTSNTQTKDIEADKADMQHCKQTRKQRKQICNATHTIGRRYKPAIGQRRKHAIGRC
ncbi:hypothetical protein C8R44DRAFT_925737 [Mycena epipterygia]|nr:hypothetical protein C8R44DRAFT_925737 [Mycena epipterygia]